MREISQQCLVTSTLRSNNPAICSDQSSVQAGRKGRKRNNFIFYLPLPFLYHYEAYGFLFNSDSSPAHIVSNVYEKTLTFSCLATWFYGPPYYLRPAGVFGRTHPVEGGRFCPPPSRLTRERMGVARRTRGRSKAPDEYFLRFFIFKGHMSGQGPVKGQNRHLSPYLLLKRD